MLFLLLFMCNSFIQFDWISLIPTHENIYLRNDTIALENLCVLSKCKLCCHFYNKFSLNLPHNRLTEDNDRIFQQHYLDTLARHDTWNRKHHTPSYTQSKRTFMEDSCKFGRFLTTLSLFCHDRIAGLLTYSYTAGQKWEPCMQKFTVFFAVSNP